MGQISAYASHKILDFLLGREAFALPASYRLALSTTPIGADGAGMTEPTDAAYGRLVINNNKVNFSAAANRSLTNLQELIFNESALDWGMVTHYALFDNSDNLWFYGALAYGVRVEDASSLILDIGAINFTLDTYRAEPGGGAVAGSSPDLFITTAVADRILDYIFGGASFSPPANYYVGVSLTPLSPEGIGATEPAASEYARLVIPNDKNTFTAAADKAVTLAKDFRFASAAEAWGNVPYYFISEAPGGESVWWGGRLKNSRNVQIGTTLAVRPGDFVWRLGSD